MLLPLIRVNVRRLLAATLVLACCASEVKSATNLSAWVYPGSSGRFLHQPDALGNRVMDFSGVGYKGGTVPIPDVPVKITISPIVGDNRAHVQNAINQVAALPLDTNGFRGAVLLLAGEYPITGSININASGVVLRGVGDSTTGTVLRASGTGQRSLIRIAGSGSPSESTVRTITSTYVPVGARSFNVDSTSGLAVGDRVFVRRNANQQWINDLGMNLLDNPWTPSGYTLNADRIITRIEGNRIFINGPITTAIEQKYGGGSVRKYTFNGRIQNVGVEYLRGVSDFVAANDEDHGWILVQINSAEHVWVRNVTSQYFGYACVALYSRTLFATVRDCRSLNPVSIVTGGRRYAFVMDDNQFSLVENCYTHDDRHHFVTQSQTIGPNAFVDGLCDNARSDAGPHHRWGNGALWDNVRVNGHQLNVRNRGNSGSGHGWAGANEVVWNSRASSFVVQNPPTARNWLIGSIGTLSTSTSGAVGPAPPGTYDSHGVNVFPNSVYYAQLQDRLAAPNLTTREYWLGEINSFSNSAPPGESVAVDSTWQTAVQSAAGGAPVRGFDVVENNQWVPFTFNFSLAPNEQVVGATLSMALRAASTASANDALYLDSVTNALSFSSLGWLPISTTTNPTVRVLDLGAQLNLLSDGRLNVAVQNDVGVDWAMLELQVAPVLTAAPNVFDPVADATVRAGAFAGNNFGTATTLTVKEDSANDNDRKAFLRWNLTGVTGTVYQAKIRLTPVAVGSEPIEHGVALVTNHAWSEDGVTWNNQPVAGKRFATWVPVTNNPVEFVVTPQVQEALQRDQQLSLQILSVQTSGSSGNVDYAAREHADPNLRPQLLLLMAGSPPVISAIANQSISVNNSTGPLAFTVSDNATPAAQLNVGAESSDTVLVPQENIILGGSGTNRTITVTPAANESGVAVITITATDADGLSTSRNFTVTVGSHAPGVFIWNGPGSGAHLWSTAVNWSPAGPAEALDNVKFFDNGATGVAVSNINNVVDASFGSRIASLHYGNTNGNHTTLISSGKMLTVSGGTGLIVGTETDNGTTQQVNATVTGANAGLALAGGNLIVRQSSDASGSQRATLDLSGLDYFNAELDRVLVGSEGTPPRPTGTLALAKTNTLTVSGSVPAIAIGGAGGGNGNAGGASHIWLGRENFVFTDSLAVGRVKQGFGGGVASSIRFNPGWTNANPANGPAAFFRGSDGESRVANWSVADSQTQGGTVHTAGAVDFTGGIVDAAVDSMVVARSSSGSGAGNPIGTLTLQAGIIDVNLLQVGFQASASANSGNNFATGTVNVHGGTLRVNNLLQLGLTSGGAGAINNRGTLNISGGGLVDAQLITSGAGTNSIAINGGTLALATTAGPGLHTLALTNAALQLRAAAGTNALTVTNLTTGAGATTVHISSVPHNVSFPAQFTLIKYTGGIGGAGFNFTLGSLPAAASCDGYLSNNVANSSVDLVINCVVPEPFLTWNGDASTDWNTTAPNWKNNLSTGLSYTSGDAVVFNDSAEGDTDINLDGTLIPASMVVSNHTKAYSFNDSGSLSGAMNLTKHGGGTLAINTTNNYTGVTTLAGGAVTTALLTNGGVASPIGAATSDPANLVFMGGALRWIASTNNTSNRGFTVTTNGGALESSPPVPANLTVSGAIAYSGNGNRTLTLGGSDPNPLAIGGNVLSSVITNGSGGATTIVKEGNNAWNLTGNNSYSGGSLVNGGRLRANTSANAFGSGPVTVADGAQAYCNVGSIFANAFFIRGLGIPETEGSYGALRLAQNNCNVTNVVTLTGNARITTRGATAAGAIISGKITGNFALEFGNSGGGAGVLTLSNNNNDWTGDTTISHGTVKLGVINAIPNGAGKGNVIINGSSATLTSALDLNGVNATINALLSSGDLSRVLVTNGFAGAATLTIGNNNASGAFGGVIKNGVGTVALTKTGSGTQTLSGNNTYTGNTTVIGGGLVVNGSLGGSAVVLVGGTTLSGNGVIGGAVTVNSGATLSPGESIGALTVNSTVTLNGVTLMELNQAANTNDVLRGVTTLNYGGTLNVTNLGGALAANDSFKLFYAAGYNGVFNEIVPATPGPGLAWNTNTLSSDGTLRIVATVVPQPVIGTLLLSGGTLIISGSNGLPNGSYQVLSSTNLAAPVSQWSPVLTNMFDEHGQFSVTNTVDLNQPNLYWIIRVIP